ncbi:glutamate/tyrosine decarboxylase-like PLP-dependent enzyme [Rhodobium orientis]|nr:aminotransferase class V-fold PLP-dependent enzyme [Rhodobium orientis]MBB4303212.1 glutamate/tyrosine decarboxylase-like PLP-dependent enzyme [Rhodobium orientis]
MKPMSLSDPVTETFARLDAAMEQDTTQWMRITRLRPQDEVRGLAHDTMRHVGMHPSAMTWGSPLGQLLTGEVSRFWGNLYNLPAGGDVAYGSSSSECIFLVLLAARTKALADGRRPPFNVIRPTSGHPAFDKAAHYLGLSVRAVSLDEDLRCDTAALRRAIDNDTIVISGALPTDSHGACDPIGEMAAIASESDIWFHVDGAIGGCLAPFMDSVGVALPAFDFTVPGVTSIGIGLHKYGYAPVGVAAALFREKSIADLRLVDMSNWDGSAMTGDRVAGLRSLDTLAGAWAIVQVLGREGYTARARAIAENQKLFAEMVRDIAGMRVLVEPTLGVVTFDAVAPQHRDFAARFAARRHRGKQIQSPGGFVVCIGPERDDDDLERYAGEIRAALAQCNS